MKGVFCLIISVLLLSACSAPKTYVRSAPFIPSLKEQGDAALAGTAGLNHIEAFVAVSPFDHITVSGQAYLAESTLVQDYAIGYYSSLGDGYVGIYAGYGTAHSIQSQRNFCLTPGSDPKCSSHSVRVAYDKFFIQPLLSAHVSEAVSFGVSTRINYVDYYNYSFEWNHWSQLKAL